VDAFSPMSSTLFPELIELRLYILIGLLVDLIDHGVNFIGFLDRPLEFVVEVFGDEAKESQHHQ
jgi:hypothetical protein